VAALTLVLLLGVTGLVERVPGSALRLVASVSLVGVMIQGLLGGFRVRLNAWAGTDLAAIHGAFAQLVFGLLVSLTVLTRTPEAAAEEASEAERYRARRPAWLLLGLVFLQLVWGAALRHTLSPASQRGHLLTAFAVVAAGVWLASVAAQSRGLWRLLRVPLAFLGVLLVVQVALGVEAWLGRFLGPGLPELRAVTVPQAAVRTLHVVVGSLILAASVVLSLRVSLPAAVPQGGPAEPPAPSERVYNAPHAQQFERTA
jgi:heme A synthase